MQRINFKYNLLICGIYYNKKYKNTSIKFLHIFVRYQQLTQAQMMGSSYLIQKDQLYSKMLNLHIQQEKIILYLMVYHGQQIRVIRLRLLDTAAVGKVPLLVSLYTLNKLRMTQCLVFRPITFLREFNFLHCHPLYPPSVKFPIIRDVPEKPTE